MLTKVLIREAKGKKLLPESSLLIAPYRDALYFSTIIRRLHFRGRVLIAGLMQGTVIPGDNCSGCRAVVLLENVAEITLCTYVCNTHTSISARDRYRLVV
jgi:hypothetical protein